MKKRKYKKFPRSIAQYNDIQIHCPHCHKKIIIFEGLYETQICSKCSYKFKDKLYKSNNAAYKYEKNNKPLENN